MGGGSLPQGGQPGAAAVNPAAGGDIYTVLANMQRNSLSAQQQQQQRGSPQPASHMVSTRRDVSDERIWGSEHKCQVCKTNL